MYPSRLKQQSDTVNAFDWSFYTRGAWLVHGIWVDDCVMILVGDENIWNRPGVEGAVLRPPRRVQGQSPCCGYGGEAPLKIPGVNCVLKALDCLKFVAKLKQVTFFSLIILFNFVQFLISFWICFFIVFSSRHFHSWSVLWTSIFFSGFPLLSCLSKIPAKQSETPYKTWDTQNVSVYPDRWHRSNFNHANIWKGTGSMYGCTV